MSRMMPVRNASHCGVCDKWVKSLWKHAQSNAHKTRRALIAPIGRAAAAPILSTSDMPSATDMPPATEMPTTIEPATSAVKAPRKKPAPKVPVPETLPEPAPETLPEIETAPVPESLPSMSDEILSMIGAAPPSVLKRIDSRLRKMLIDPSVALDAEHKEAAQELIKSLVDAYTSKRDKGRASAAARRAARVVPAPSAATVSAIG